MFKVALSMREETRAQRAPQGHTGEERIPEGICGLHMVKSSRKQEKILFLDELKKKSEA